MLNKQAPAAAEEIVPDSNLRAPLSLCLAGPIQPAYVEGPLTTQLFEQQARLDPGRPCLVFEGATLSYGEVNARANRLARTLRTLGVKRNVAVGLMMERSFELVIAMLAAMKAGGLYVPLDPDYPADRLTIYMEDSAAVVLIAHAAHVAKVSGQAGWTVLVAEEIDWEGGDGGDLPPDLIKCDSLAYVIFTSGARGVGRGLVCSALARATVDSPLGASLPQRQAWHSRLLSLYVSCICLLLGGRQQIWALQFFC